MKWNIVTEEWNVSMSNPVRRRVAFTLCCLAFLLSEPDLTGAPVKDRFQQEGPRQQSNDFPGVCACGEIFLLQLHFAIPITSRCSRQAPARHSRIRHCPSSSMPSLWHIQAHHGRSAWNEMNIQILCVNICRQGLFSALILKAAVTV